MQLEWDGKTGPAFVVGVAQLVALLVGGAVVWTQLTDKVENTGAKIETISSTVKGLRHDLKQSQTERAEQSERLGRVETSITYLTAFFQKGVNSSDGVALPPPFQLGKQLPKNP